jgi:AcrR family transcriptional regulator
MPATTPAPGRPREDRVDASVREAVLVLLDRHGYAGTTIERIAAHAKVGRGALYRRWSSKAEIVFACLVHPTELGPPPDTGSLRGDLEVVAGIVRERLGTPTTAAALAALAAELRTEPGLALALEERLFAEERRWLASILQAARDRGELRADPVDPELVRQAVIGPFAVAMLFSPQAPPPSAAAVSLLITRGLVA